MSYETDFDTAFAILLGKAKGLINQPGIVPVDTGTGGGTTTTPVSLPIQMGIAYIIDGGGSAITNGSFGGIILPIPIDLTGIELQEFDGTSGNITVDIRSGTPGTSPSFTSITGGNVPKITSGRYYADGNLSGWTTQLAVGTALQFVVSGASTIKRVTVSLYARRTDI